MRICEIVLRQFASLWKASLVRKRLCNLHRQSVSEYVRRFNKGGMELLLDRKFGEGRPCSLTKEQLSELKETVLTSTPADCGLGIAVSWEVPLVREHIKRTYEVELCRTAVLRMLWRLSLSYTRPTYVRKKADAKKQKAFLRQMEWIKKNALEENTVLLYEDETHIRSDQSLRATWAQSGKQKQVPTYGHHAYVTVFGTVQADTGKSVTSLASQGKQEQYVAFLQLLLQEYKGKFIFLVVDGAPIHRSRAVKDFLAAHQDHLMTILLPPYSPNLNPIERLWKWLKEQVIANKFHPTTASIEESVTSFLTEESAMPSAVMRRLGLH